MLVLSLSLGRFEPGHSKSLLALALAAALSGYLYAERRRYFFWLALLSAMPASVLFIYYHIYIQNHIQIDKQTVRYLITCVGANIIVMLLSALPSRLWLRRTLLALLTAPFAIISVTFWAYYLSMGAWFGTDAMLAIMQTNTAEARDYLLTYITWRGAAAGIGILGAFAAAVCDASRLRLRKEKRLFWLTAALVAVVCAAQCSQTRQNLLSTVLWYDLKPVLRSYDNIRRMRAQRKSRLAAALSATALPEPRKGVFVLVIGESLTRDRMSAYGCPRPTTPWLDKAAGRSNFIQFTSAYSCIPSTAGSLNYALTEKNQYNAARLKDAVTLLEAAEAAGFETVWLSKQTRFGVWGTPITNIAEEANQQVWIADSPKVESMTGYDLDLVNCLKGLNLSDRMLIIFHLQGSHWRYREDYPPSFEVFSGGGSDADAYDNSVLYNDFVMSKIYDSVKELPGFSCMIYFSDYGEDVGSRGHDAAKFIWPMVRIPMYAAFSESFMQDHPETVAALRAAKDKVFTNDLIFNLTASVMDIKIPGLYEAENDPAAPTYNDNPARFRTLYGKKAITEDLR